VDLQMAGISSETFQRVIDPQAASLAERYELLLPYWRKIRNTAYARMYFTSLRELLGVQEFTVAELEAGTARLRELQHPGYYREMLPERYNLEVVLWDKGFHGKDRELTSSERGVLTPVAGADWFLCVWNRQQVLGLERDFEVSLHRLEDFVDLTLRTLDRLRQWGCPALKNAMAYARDLGFDKVSRHEAELAFNRIFAGRGEGCSRAEVRPLQSYTLHAILQWAQAHEMTMIFHTGLQASGYNYISEANPVLLTNLFMEYRDLHFNLFHSGYPYVRECGVLANYFPNVWADLAWTHFISGAGVRQFLLDWLDLVPSSKILGFGDDLRYPELIAGHLYMARENLAAVLAERVTRGWDTREEALALARRLLRDNAHECFRN
jgi:predicted TIM-barrel fold metal-dependent hydrolase